MKYISRREALLAASSMALPASAGCASAQTWPDQNIKALCAFPPGSGLDILVRFFAEKLRPLCGRPVLVENRPGAGGAIATEAAIRAKPDGYTLYIHAGNALAASHHLIKNNPFDVRQKLTMAATISRQAYTLAVDAKSPFKTLAELTAHLKVKGDKATYATAGAGVAVGEVMGEIYNQTMGLKAVSVNYRTADASLSDMASGRVDFACHDPVFALAQQREGRLRVLAVASKDRRATLPDVPSMTELGVPMDLLGWFAIMLPVGADEAIIAKLNGWTRQILDDPETTKFLANFGGEPWASTPAEGQARLNYDIDAWADFVRIARLQPQ